MSFLQAMYQKQDNTQNSKYKNPNRVSGGLKGQGVDHVVFVSEDGKDHEITTLKYTQSLENKIKDQYNRMLKIEQANNMLSRKISKLNNGENK